MRRLMYWLCGKTTDSRRKINERAVDNLVDLEKQNASLPDLPPVERIKLEYDTSLEHLYYSSALEGSVLNLEQLRIVTRDGFRKTC